MARDRPPPYDDVPFFSRALSVVCDRLITNGSGSGDPELQRKGDLTAKRMARETRSPARVASEGPSPYDDVPFFSRSAGACPPRAPSSRGGILGPLGPTCLIETRAGPRQGPLGP